MPCTDPPSVDWRKKYKHFRLKSSGRNLILVGISNRAKEEVPLASFCPEGAELAGNFLHHLLTKLKEVL